MSHVVNLTRPIAVASVAGSVLPWESPYRTEPIATLKLNGANLFHIEMSPSAATRLVGARIVDPKATSTRDLDPSTLLNRSATMVRVPGEPGRGLTGADLTEALDQVRPLHGDALVLVTGWGDQAPEVFTGEGYVCDAPYLLPEAVEVLRKVLAEIDSHLLLTDMPYIDRAGGTHAREEWMELQPWVRPPWPSPNAGAYVRHYTKSKVEQDWSATFALLRTAWTVLGLVGCAALGTTRVLLNIAPFQVVDVGEVPCTVVAAPL